MSTTSHHWKDGKDLRASLSISQITHTHTLRTIVLLQCKIDDNEGGGGNAWLPRRWLRKQESRCWTWVKIWFRAGFDLQYLFLHCKPLLEKYVLREECDYRKWTQRHGVEYYFVTCALCDTSSIKMTYYSSNHHFHTLESSDKDEEGIPDDVLSRSANE